MTRLPIHIDPFFDGDGFDQPATPRAPQIPATPPGPNGYYDASQVQLRDGRAATQGMRPSNQGLHGTVIPRATMGGIPVGTRPHAMADLRVTIDPHIGGQSSVVRLGDVTQQAIVDATQIASGVTPDPYSIETQRLRGAAVLHAVAANNRVAAPAQPGFDGMTTPGNIPAPNMGNYAQPMFVRRVSSPLQALNQPPPHLDPESGRPLRAIDMRSSPVERSGPAAPTVEVTFELEQFGTHTAYYHDVLTLHPGFIVLLYNNSYRGGSRYFPQSRENAPPMALNVVGRPEVFLAHCTGLQFSHGDWEYCILLVERQVTAPAEQAEAQ